MPIVVIAAGKGGVGKTTSCLAIGAGLRELGLSPTLLDLDAGGDLTWNAGLEPGGTRAVDLLAGRRSLTDAAVATNEGLALVPAAPDLAQLELGDPRPVTDRLRTLGATALLVIDTPPGFASALSRAAIAAADVLAVPIELEPTAARRAVHALDVAAGLGVSPRPVVFGTKVDGRRALTAETQAELEANGTTLVALVPRLVAAAEAPKTGRSVIAYEPRSEISTAYRHVARTIADELDAPRRNRKK